MLTSVYARAAVVVLLGACCVGCNNQEGYLHQSQEFTKIDLWAIKRVRATPLSSPVVLRSLAFEITGSSTEVSQCGDSDFEVKKVVRRDLSKVQGAFLEEMHVICKVPAHASDKVLLRFEWIFNSDLSSLVGFKFGIDPSEYPSGDFKE